jgi:hypothetical protein
MWSRLAFWLIAIFWLTMGVLLWRAEFGGGAARGAAVPVNMVWQKILTAPDNSSLEIRQGTNRIGLCRWSANLGQEQATGARFIEDQPEGMVKTLSSYTLDLDGNFTQAELGGRVRFGCALVLATNHAWQEFHLRLNLRPDAYAVHARAATEKVRLLIDDENGHADTSYTFAELRNPQKLLRDIGGPLLPATVAALGVPLSTNQLSGLSAALQWEAHQDWLQLGRTRLRTYRLNGRLLDRFEVVVHVSPVGEILRVELPGKILLVNEAVSTLRPSRHD